MKATKFFSDHEKTRIAQAVAGAEALTSAEIVPVVAASSGRYDRAEDIVGLWTGATAMAATWLAFHWQTGADAQWGPSWGRYELPLLVSALALGFVAGTLAAGYIPVVRRVFAPRKEMNAEVSAAASRLFCDRRVHHTAGNEGLLIYVSLFERMAAVIADETVLKALGTPALSGLCEKLIDGIRAGDTATALCDVIAEAGRILAPVLPRADGDKNELGDALILVD